MRILESTEELYEPLTNPLGSCDVIEPLKIPLPSVICDEPLSTPLGSDEITWAEDDIVPLGISVWEPLVNPNAVIWAEPLIVPAGTEPPPPLGNVIVLPVLIVNSLPSIESVCESVSDVK